MCHVLSIVLTKLTKLIKLKFATHNLLSIYVLCLKTVCVYIKIINS